ncbi:EF-hand domain pair [Phytophthora cinnamomi]|uniref:EF-hand domain pair n=1 Tax=Phytophthora cinnamomi TaxID=4785 RepID=UPI003559AC60|nr:EF-hand domain pair [Phytophthora cinnamomi]
MRVQVAAADEKFISDEEDIAVALEEDEEVMKMEEDEEVMKMEEDEEVMKIVKNLRRSSGKAAQEQVARDQVQFQKIQGRAAQQHSSDDETATLRPGKGDIPTNIKNATATRGIKLFSVDILLRIINQLYRDNYEGMVSTLQYGNRRMEFSEFIYDWHIRKYGLKALAQRHLLKLIQSLRKHEKKVFQCQLCLRFMGIQNPLGFHEHKFVLGLLSRWSLGTFLGGSKHRVEIPKREFKIRIAIAISTVQEALRERFGAYARGMDALAERIRAKALSRDEEFIRENDLLILCVDEFGSQRALLEKVLGAVYLAGDINGDGSLEFDEFASVVTHLSPTVDDGFMQKVFEAAHDYSKPNRISFARFLDVILLERVLNPAPLIARAKTTTTGSAGGTNSAGSGGSSHPRTSTIKAAAQDEQEEEYQFELLRETWTHDREAVQQVLQTSITHSPTAKTLSFRVAFLDQLLSRRVDSKTAWLCHRQIMREIARYQHLDADQIAGLRSKELQFKKTVRAIRNAQWLRTIFAVPSATPDATGDEATAADVPNTDALDPPQVPASYTAAVRLSLDIQAPGATNVADVAALENELRETFLERADEGAIEDYMAAMQHLRRVSITQQSLQLVLESREESSLMRTEGAVPEGSEESDTEEEDDESKEDGAGYDGEEVVA